ncbi:MAG: hypothetical protein CK533_09020 [Acidobacterium sp.]|nr:MAG: hypothetical protein CK533_09020 [Acidobacterium sp.]
MGFGVLGGDGALKGTERSGVEGDGVFDVFGDVARGIEVTLLSPARRGAGDETTQTQGSETTDANDHRILQTHESDPHHINVASGIAWILSALVRV